jgi:NADPH2:quinone reductase
MAKRPAWRQTFGWIADLQKGRVAGGSIFGYIEDPNEMQARAAAVVRGIQEGWLRIGATTNFALGDAVAAHRAIEGRTTQGKLALIPESHG